MNAHLSRLLPLLAGAAFAAPALPAQDVSQPVALRARDVREEQRHISDYLTYSASDLQTGLERAGGNNLDLATVSGLHAVAQLLQCSKLMDNDPQHVEQIHSWFDSDYTRAELRNTFFGILKPRYDDLEERIDAFAHSLKDRGYSAVLYTINKLRAWNNTADPGAKDQLEHEITQVVTDVSRAATSRPGGGSDASTGLSAGGESGGGGGSGGFAPLGGSYTPGQGGTVALGNGLNAFPGAGGVTVQDGYGHQALIPGATLNPDGTARLADGRTVDLRNAALDPSGNVRLADGEVLGQNGGGSGGGFGAAPLPDANSRFVSPDGSEIVIPADFNWKDGVATGIEKVYVGGRGDRLIRETKVTFRPTPAPNQPNTYVVARENGESRSWQFDVTTVPGSERKSTGSLTASLELADRRGNAGFTVDNWTINGPAGSPALGGSPGNTTTATFTASGEYTVEVTGRTDWGSAFTIKKTLPVGVD
jgi:hypothetical protein